MCGCHRFVTSRYQQGQPLGIVAGSLYPYSATFHGAGLRTVAAAAYRIIKIVQAEITLVIRAGKPFLHYAANTTTSRQVNAKSTGTRPSLPGSGTLGRISFPL